MKTDTQTRFRAKLRPKNASRTVLSIFQTSVHNKAIGRHRKGSIGVR